MFQFKTRSTPIYPASLVHIKQVDCPDCRGKGQFWIEPFNPSERAHWQDCQNCHGFGAVDIEINEETEED